MSMFDYFWLTVITFGFLVAIVYLILLAFDSVRKPTPNIPIVVGEVTGFQSDDQGLRIIGKFNDNGIKMFEQGHDKMSLGFSIDDKNSKVNHGIKTFASADLFSVSLDSEPGPYGGKVEWVGKKDA